MGTPFAGDAPDHNPLFDSPTDLPADTSSMPPARRRRSRLAPVIAIIVIVLVVIGGLVAVNAIRSRLTVADYTGSGSGSTQVRVNAGDGAGDVADTLKAAGVVKSARAFTKAAEKSGKAGDIQPGLYRVPLKASGQAALDALLDPKNRLVSRVTIPEGQTRLQILTELADKTKVPLADLQKAAGQVADLGLPAGFAPKTIEGFLYPATYEFDPSQSALEIVQTLTSTFNTQWVKLGIASSAAAYHLSPYQALIVASMVEAEAKFPEDRPKIARVILNRLAAGMELKIDAANRYGAGLLGLDANKIDYETLNSPYNTYAHKGLPPGPISNPGEASLKAAAHPADGNWLYYVVMDAQGHHLFTADDQVFEQAAQRCRDNNWGCG